MSHQLFRLSQSIWNKPHLITQESFNVVLDYLAARNSGLLSYKLSEPVAAQENLLSDNGNEGDEDDNTDSSLAVINIDGSLTYKPVMTMCGEAGTSYADIEDSVEDAIEAGCQTMVLNVSSGGGEASHVFETATNIRQMCDDNNVKLVAYIDTLGCSAAYALSVIADTVIANPSATVGSIGCVLCLTDTSKAEADMGVKRIFITSGADKVPYAADGSFKQSFLDDIQVKVDNLNTEFTEFVSKYSGLSTETIRGFEANSFTAQEALDKGLVNSIMTNKQFAAYIADLHKGAM